MFQVESIIAAVSVAFRADANTTALCPGGMWHRRAASEEQGQKRPYAVLTVVALEEKEFISDQTCLQGFLLTLRIYGNEQTDTTGKIAGYLSAWDLDRHVLQGIPARIIGLFPSAEDIDLDAEEKTGKDVVIAAKQWLLKLHYLIGTIPNN